jgi:hypothetical protein
MRIKDTWHLASDLMTPIRDSHGAWSPLTSLLPTAKGRAACLHVLPAAARCGGGCAALCSLRGRRRRRRRREGQGGGGGWQLAGGGGGGHILRSELRGSGPARSSEGMPRAVLAPFHIP